MSGTGQRLGVATLIVSTGVLLARLLGFAREMVFAYVLGAAGESDAYFLAFVIPDFINYLLAGGYLSITFIPILSRFLSAGDEAGAWRVFWGVTWPITGAIILAVLGAWLLAPMILPILGPGLDAAQLADAVRLTRIVLPAQVFFVVGSLFVAVQYSRDRFVVPTLAGLVYNLGIIAGGLVLGALFGLAVDGFAWGVLVGALVGNLGIQILGARAAGLRFAAPRFDRAALSEYLALAFPLMIGQSVVVLDEQLTRTMGSLVGVGALSWLNYARRLMLVPVGVVAQAAGVAAYPHLARLAAAGQLPELAASLAKACRYVVFASIIAAGYMVAAAEPIVRLVYERGRFDATDTAATAPALAIYAVAIPLWGAQQIVARGFYARRQMWTPVLVGTLATMVSIPAYALAAEHSGHLALAATSGAVLLVYTAVLLGIWRWRLGPAALAGLGGGVVRGLGAALPASAAAAVAVQQLTLWVVPALGGGSVASLVVLVGAAVVYAFALVPILVLVRAREIDEVGRPLWLKVRRRLGR